MRKTIAVATAAVMVAGGTQLPASAVGPDAPTDVQVSWLNPKVVGVTWADGGQANIVRVEYENGILVTKTTRKADAPNEYTRAGAALATPDRVVRISVVSVDEAGVESAPAVSPWFDTIGSPLPTFTAGTPLADGSLKLDWSLADVPADTTPNDPLDRPATDETVRLYVNNNSPNPGLGFRLPAGSTTTTLPPIPRPYPVSIWTDNEWVIRGGATGSSSVVFNAMTAGLTVPAAGVYSESIQLAAVAGTRLCATPLVNCLDPTNPFVANPGIQTELQSRPDAAHPWKTIVRYSNKPLSFPIGFRVYGGSQYRLYVPAWSHLNVRELTVAPAISSSARANAVRAKLLAAGFNTTSAQVGQVVTATVNILPAGTVNADLQWSDGKVWRHSTYIQLTKGKGTFSFKAAGRGTTRSWRVIIPKMTMNGLPIVPTTSGTFKLTVR